MKVKNISRILALLLAVLVFLPLPARAASTMEALMTEHQVYTYLTRELGLNSAAACGVLANIEHESAFQVTIVGDGGTSYGLCQWHAGRFTALRSYCGARGLDYRTAEGQLAYLGHELIHSYGALLTALQTVENSPEGAYRAAAMWCTQFERPANMQEKAVERGNSAQFKYWNRYNAVSIVLEPEEPELPPEQIISMMQQEVEIPLPPYDHSAEIARMLEAELRHYVPHHLPREEEPAPVWPVLVAAGAVIVAVAGWRFGRILPVFPGKKQDPEPAS